VPDTRLANALVAVEALVGLLGFAILSGLLFARFTRPTAKIQFSDNALIAPYGDGWALMFRLVNLRNHDLTDVHATVSFARWTVDNDVRHRQFDQLDLERPFIIFMPLHWIIVHPITDHSPLRGFTEESLAPPTRRSCAWSAATTRRSRRPCTPRRATTRMTSSGALDFGTCIWRTGTTWPSTSAACTSSSGCFLHQQRSDVPNSART
jgi:inward rectifier potassium channel